jgi:hypothetical protein
MSYAIKFPCNELPSCQNKIHLSQIFPLHYVKFRERLGTLRKPYNSFFSYFVFMYNLYGL